MQIYKNVKIRIFVANDLWNYSSKQVKEFFFYFNDRVYHRAGFKPNFNSATIELLVFNIANMVFFGQFVGYFGENSVIIN